METNSIQVFTFGGADVEFNFAGNQVMVNATEMAKIFGAQVNEFLSNQKTKAFLEECLKNGNSRFLEVEKEEDLIFSRQKSGTWMHRVLALKFAAWLDLAFELWVFRTIDTVLFGRYREMEAQLKTSAERKVKMEALKRELATNETYIELERLEKLEKEATYVRRNEASRQLKIFIEQLN
jgi:hypothetical protein